MTTRKPAVKPAGPDEASAVSFEKALERLEAIVGEMESGAVSLEKMIERFEEGQKLIGLCTRRLNEVERRIEILVKRGDDVVAEPFESDETPPEMSGSAPEFGRTSSGSARPAPADRESRNDDDGKNELF